MAWDPAVLERFRSEREQPFLDCLALVRRRPKLRVVDLGCGTGELTARLCDALVDAEVLGIDNSPEMLSKAPSRPNLQFLRGTIEEFADGGDRYDLIFSHAAFHWVDDHRVLLPKLLARLNPGGQLVAQLPSNHHHPSHTELRRLAESDPFLSALGGWRREVPVLGIDEYASILFEAVAMPTVFEKVYAHVLPTAADLITWQRGTALVPYRERLPTSLYTELEVQLLGRMKEFYPGSPVFFGFRRILMAADMEKEKSMAKYKGKVVKSDLEGGMWQLETDEGDVYVLDGGGADLRHAGARVEVDGAVDGGAMGIGFGTPVLKVKKYKLV